MNLICYLTINSVWFTIGCKKNIPMTDTSVSLYYTYIWTYSDPGFVRKHRRGGIFLSRFTSRSVFLGLSTSHIYICTHRYVYTLWCSTYIYIYISERILRERGRTIYMYVYILYSIPFIHIVYIYIYMLRVSFLFQFPLAPFLALAPLLHPRLSTASFVFIRIYIYTHASAFVHEEYTHLHRTKWKVVALSRGSRLPLHQSFPI